MRVAIIGGTGFYKMHSGQFEARTISTPYGEALVFMGQSNGQGSDDDLVFLARHGPDHHIPPHRINYRANLKALQQLEVEAIIATFAVGSLHTGLPPHSLVLLDQFIDFTEGRDKTFFDGGPAGLAHIEVTNPYCEWLRQALLKLAPAHGLTLAETGTYVCTNGPRFETAAEVRLLAQWGGDVVGMTGVPEVSLARELGIHYAGVALSINWGAGLQGRLTIAREGLDAIRAAMLPLFVEALRTPSDHPCDCQSSLLTIHPPESER